MQGSSMLDRIRTAPWLREALRRLRSRPWLSGAVAAGLAGLALLAMRPDPPQEEALVVSDRMAGVEQVETVERIPPRWDDWPAPSESFFDPHVDLPAAGGAVELIPPPPYPSADAWPRTAGEIRPAAFSSAGTGEPRGAWLTGSIEVLD